MWFVFRGFFVSVVAGFGSTHDQIGTNSVCKHFAESAAKKGLKLVFNLTFMFANRNNGLVVPHELIALNNPLYNANIIHRYISSIDAILSENLVQSVVGNGQNRYLYIIVMIWKGVNLWWQLGRRIRQERYIFSSPNVEHTAKKS